MSLDRSRASLARDVYRFGGASVAVETDDADTARWLSEFLSPWFALEAGGEAPLRVRFIRSTERFAALAGREAQGGLDTMPCFRLDTSLVSCPSWIDADGARYLSDQERGCYYRIAGTHIDIVASPESGGARVGLMRVIRELATGTVLSRDGWLDLHAAAFTVHGRAVLLIGPKNAGKTTLLTYALQSRRTALMTNDRVIVDESCRAAHGVPTIVSIREGTAVRFPALGHGVTPRAFLSHTDEAAASGAGVAADDGRIALSPAQYARQLHVPIAPSAPIAAIVCVDISSAIDAWVVTPLELAEARARLRANLYSRDLGSHEPTLLQQLVGQLAKPAIQQAAVDRLAAQVPVLRCTLGPNAYRGPADAWLNALKIDGHRDTP